MRLTTDSRGHGSRVSLSQDSRSGNFDRRLYGGRCRAMSRSSRTCASSVVAQTMPSTRWASMTISPMRVRVSDSVK